MVCVALGGFAVLSPDAWAEPSPERSGFTPAEKKQLSSGRLVVRPQTSQRDGLRLMGGGSWQIIDASPSVVWRALLDTSHYRNMLPSVVEARLLAHKGPRREVYLRQGTWPVYVSYHLLVDVDEANRQVRFRVDPQRKNSIAMGWGFLHVQPYGEGRSLLAYGIMADGGSGIVASVARGTVHEWMLKVPWTVKRFLESGGKNYYQ
jgi:hypothetical protein